MSKKLDVVIIGSGSAGLSALRQVKKHTGNYLLVNHGPLGTTCARVGCMPSKVLIHLANECHNSRSMLEQGLIKADRLSPDIPAVMTHVRTLRDSFAGGMREDTLKLADGRLLEGKAEICAPDCVRVAGKEFKTSRIIIAAGSSPVIPKAWKGFSELILTSENAFEQEDFPRRVGVIGLGTIGLEIGQALSRLGVEVHAFDQKTIMGGLTDPEINEVMFRLMKEEFSVHAGQAADIEDKGTYLLIKAGKEEIVVDKIVAAVGSAPNLQGLGLENLGLELDSRGLPPFEPRTMQVGDLPVFIAGDVNDYSPILHEALDEGFIAGVNSMKGEVSNFCRRTNLKIVFSDPQIAIAGQSFEELKGQSIVIGKADFEKQSRARVEGRNRGRLHIYVDSDTLQLLGAEMAVPEAEHLAHLLALALENRMTIADLLHMPFYHPTVEEGLRTALRDAMQQLPEEQRPSELNLCRSCPEPTLS